MDGHAHRVVGAIVGGVGYLGACRLLGRQATFGGFAVAVGGGVLVASLHDVLEPAIHPNHRAFFHSIAFNGFLAVSLRRGWLSPSMPSEQKMLVAVLGLACLSHPCLDAFTPKGLPLL
jgi:membrane-bound metal-dependent hydrolase YbcI (DUF457 family)